MVYTLSPLKRSNAHKKGGGYHSDNDALPSVQWKRQRRGNGEGAAGHGLCLAYWLTTGLETKGTTSCGTAA